MPLLLLILFNWFGLWAVPVGGAGTIVEAKVEHVGMDERAHVLFDGCGLNGVMDEEAFRAAFNRCDQAGTANSILAIADMTRPSTEKRLFIIDLKERKLLLQTWVAHGKNSGELYCEHVSNRSGSLQTSKGLYRVGEKIISPKHGEALLLHGLDPGVNSAALQREIIIHGADYVSADFIAQHGRLGRSFGCPAVPREVMPKVAELLEGKMLYVFVK
ncbi:MAG TPA: murein L,D-transpeptidase catalytic domain family protein [Flavobacteriales bacterium]|nr:murein L,D-transpeptidase catalytic domain family protein [Flavobacteriales bacterium]